MKTSIKENVAVLFTNGVSRIPAPTKPHKEESSNLHKSFKKLFIMAQIFGFFPVQGISGPDYRSLCFSWKSIRVIYSLFAISGAFFLSLMQIHKMVTKEVNLMEINRFCFNSVGVIGGMLFLWLAKNWPRIMRYWNEVELSMRYYGWPKRLNTKLNMLTVVLMTMALSKYFSL